VFQLFCRFIIETLLELTSNNTIILFTEKLASAKHLLNKIRLDGRISDLKINTVSTLQLENGKFNKIASTLDGLRGCNYMSLSIMHVKSFR
jgi:hypothetical protein